jgi:peptidoglycan hydrolase-like protein with peptidoglycan-binding domain
MWIAALVIWIVLGMGTAAAFECVGVKLPSTIVICSDLELMRLADERQEAINEARGRIGEEQWPALWEDQKAWVRSYATACGVPPDRPPPIPAPASIKACFKRAAETRIAYIRAYNPAPDQSASPSTPSTARLERIGPGFDCNKAAAPLALMICGDPGLSQLDFRFNQAYWALFQRLGPGGQAQLKAEDVQLIEQVQQQCGVLTSGPLTTAAWQSRDCIKDAYERQRQTWVARLIGPAYEEAVRSPERHLTLQKDLQDLGFIPAGPIDGVYGPATRTGVAAWQSRHGLAVTGLVGDAEARMIEREVIASPIPDRGQSSPLGPAIEEIPLKNVGGVYVVGVRINGAITLDFIVDSGASDVQIPADVAMTLARAGTISSNDFIGDREYRLGDGSTLKSERFILRELKIGGQALQNIVASIGSMKGEPLLGQSFLARFASWSVDNNRHALVLGELRR